ncbi:TBC1 domain family member 19 [Eumeta japonica]|uniref:TBC1 domain family member 19 n=1 Tax=Eumeta variegata TaxID=151549 RepID=A0A4C1SXW1_EUMVA|nr:TBC1 domain family member 19 [Eumeta japonica]
MNNFKDDAIHQTALKLAEEIKNLSIYKTFYSDVQKLVSSPNITKDDFRQTLQQAMKEKGLDIKLRNTVYHWVRTQNKQHKDPLSSLVKASTQWEKRIHKSLNSMCSDLETSLAKIRSQTEQEEMSEKWNELSTFSLDLSKYRPVYAPKDFLEVLLTLSGYLPFPKENEPKWEFAHLPLQVKTLEQLRKQFPEFAKGEPLLGVNSLIASCAAGFASLESERVELGERVAALGYAPVIQEYLKKGSPQCLRARLWAQVLGAEVKAQVMLCFSRDSEVMHHLKGSIGNPLIVPIKGRPVSTNNNVVFPPSEINYTRSYTTHCAHLFAINQCLWTLAAFFDFNDGGVQSCHVAAVEVLSESKMTSHRVKTKMHWIHCATPFCYLYDEPAQLYYTFRIFYLRYWHRLHFISTHPQGIVALCLLYERLLEANEPLLWIHFRNININPIRVVFKWLMRAFSGHLPPEQLLFLWDAVLGYDSLELLPLLAVAILSFRKENIFQADKRLLTCLLCNKVLSNDSMKPSKLEDHLRRCHSDKIGKDLKYFQTLKEKYEKRPTVHVNEIRSNPLNTRLFAQLCNENDEDFQRLLLHTEVRWVSKGACLSRFYLGEPQSRSGSKPALGLDRDEIKVEKRDGIHDAHSVISYKRGVENECKDGTKI